MRMINYTELRFNLKHWMDKIGNDVSLLMIKRKSSKDLVLILLSEYNSLQETIYLLTGKNRDVLLTSIEELELGNGTEKQMIEK